MPPATPWDSMRAAVLTASPQASYAKRVVPTTAATSGPESIPIRTPSGSPVGVGHAATVSRTASANSAAASAWSSRGVGTFPVGVQGAGGHELAGVVPVEAVGDEQQEQEHGDQLEHHALADERARAEADVQRGGERGRGRGRGVGETGAGEAERQDQR